MRTLLVVACLFVSYPAIAEETVWGKGPNDQAYYCENYAGSDIGERCNAAYADIIADDARGGTIVIGRGSFSQSTVIDLCDETGEGNHVPVTLIAEGGAPSSPATRLDAASSLRPSTISGTSFSVSAGTGSGSRDQITCVGCDFTAYFKRGDRLETSGFSNSVNNINRTEGDLPLIVWRAEETDLTVEGELLDAGLTTDATADSATVQKLVPQVEICASDQSIKNITLNGTASEYADFGVLMRPDNQVQDGCIGSLDPYSFCTGLGTSDPAQKTIISRGNVLSEITTQNQKYAGVFVSSTNSMGQADNFVIENSILEDAPISVWADSLQAHPAIVVRENDINGFSLNGIRVSSGAVFAMSNTIITGDSDCDADTYGTCRYAYLGAGNTLGLSLVGNDFEIGAGDGVYVAGLNGAARHLYIVGNSFQHNDAGRGAGAMSFVQADGFCGAIVNDGNKYRTTTASITTAPTVTFANSNQASCKTTISGLSSYSASGAGSSAATLSVGGGSGDKTQEISGTSETLSALWMDGRFFYCSNASGCDITLPLAQNGLEACFYESDGAGSVTLDVDDSDVIYLEGTALDAGDSITSPGNSGDLICMVALDDTKWITTTENGSWIDGGP